MIQSRSGKTPAAQFFCKRAAIALIILYAVCAIAQKAVWCGKPAGLLERNYTFEESTAAVNLAQSLAGGDAPFLFIRRTSINAQVRAQAGAIFPVAMAMDKSSTGVPKSTDVPKMTADEIEQAMRDPQLQSALNDLLDAAKNSPAEPNWYFYSNSPRLGSYFEKDRMLLDKPEKGALLLMDKAGEQKGWSRAVADMAQYIGAGLILIDGDAPSDLSLPAGHDRAPLVLKLKSAQAADQDRIAKGISTIDKLRTADMGSVSVLFLMPESQQEATAWGFDEEKANQYVTNGNRVLRDLAAYGLAGAVSKPKTRQDAISAVNAAFGSQRNLVVVVGEEGGNGGVRVPGSADVFRSADLPAGANGNTTLLGLVCDSQSLLTSQTGLSVIGTVYTDQIRHMVRVLFDNRAPATYAEYLDVPYSTATDAASRVSDTLASVARHITFDHKGEHNLPALIAMTSPTPATPAAASSASTLASATGSGAPSAPASDSQKAPSDEPPALPVLFLSGVIGACGREILRWRRLSGRKRADLFRHPKYFAVSVFQILVGGAAAMIFGRLAFDPWTYVIGFVSGAGLEELVRRAMMLKVWTPPVGHGPGESTPSLLEYLRA